MKKTYIEPAIKNLAMAEEDMICASLAEAGSTSDNQITTADSRETSYHVNIWDEETEE